MMAHFEAVLTPGRAFLLGAAVVFLVHAAARWVQRRLFIRMLKNAPTVSIDEFVRAQMEEHQERVANAPFLVVATVKRSSPFQTREAAEQHRENILKNPNSPEGVSVLDAVVEERATTPSSG